MKWNLRLVAAQRDVWKASELQRRFADAGLVISAGKMSGLWSGQPVTIRLDDLDVICQVLNCTPADLLIPEPVAAAGRDSAPEDTSAAATASGDLPQVVVRRQVGRSRPPR